MMARVGWYNVKLRRKHGAEAWWNDEENEVPIDRQEEENVSCRQVRRLAGGGGDGGGCWQASAANLRNALGRGGRKVAFARRAWAVCNW